MITALAIGVPLLLLVMARIGDLVPFLLFIGCAVVMIFAMPPMNPQLYIAVPLGLAAAYKFLRGDKRNTKGGRMP